MIHDLNQFAISKNVIKDFPDAIKKLDMCIKILESSKKYKPINEIFLLMEKNKQQMQYLLNHYTKINQNLGKIDE